MDRPQAPTYADLVSSLFDDYRPLPGAQDEMVLADGSAHPELTRVFEHFDALTTDELARAQALADLSLLNQGVTFSEASHAWVQVYLPEVGWMGFDPTNGVLTRTDHVRVAVGRSYVDATPTAGTIYVGGGGETLEVEVTVEPVDPASKPA